MSYTAGDLIEIFRREVDDPIYFADNGLPQPNTLWSNYQLIKMLDTAQVVWAERTLGFSDSTTFTQDILADEPFVKHDSRIIRVNRAELGSDGSELDVTNLSTFSSVAFKDDYGRRLSASWTTDTGTPTAVIADVSYGELRLWPTPVADDTLVLYTYRYPLHTLTSAGDCLEIPERYQLGLLDKLRSDAYSQPKALAAGFAEAGLKASVDWENFLLRCSGKLYIKNKRPNKVRYGGL